MYRSATGSLHRYLVAFCVNAFALRQYSSCARIKVENVLLGEAPGFSENILEQLMIVQVTPHISEDGIARAQMYNSDGTKSPAFRPVQYFALNTIVPDWALGSEKNISEGREGSIVDQREYIIMIPYRNIENRILNIWPIDTIVAGDIDLASVGATILHPFSKPIKFAPGVSIKTMAYASDKRTSVDYVLKRNGYAVRESIDRVSMAGVSAVYRLPSGIHVQLGAGPTFGNANIDFITTRYKAQVSFGGEQYLYLRNGATDALFGLMWYSTHCQSKAFKRNPMNLRHWKGLKHFINLNVDKLKAHPRFTARSDAFPSQSDALTACTRAHHAELPSGYSPSWLAVADDVDKILSFAQVLLEPERVQSFISIFKDCGSHIDRAFVSSAKSLWEHATGRTSDLEERPPMKEPKCTRANPEYWFWELVKSFANLEVINMMMINGRIAGELRKTVSALEQVTKPREADKIRLVDLQDSMESLAKYEKPNLEKYAQQQRRQRQMLLNELT
eukprot:TRINITY_DN64344_c0_g1_i1.p1 TRINITY_DN64344_c0_g1~~TRINITY_DN64344_c0_g1_i1.p1  ORF type:complete len:504 (+),score=44.19 TRINITY_DN64344_c0_g1_i1:49-1560(+)